MFDPMSNTENVNQIKAYGTILLWYPTDFAQSGGRILPPGRGFGNRDLHPPFRVSVQGSDTSLHCPEQSMLNHHEQKG